MNSDSSILVDDLSKAYRVWEDPAARLVSPLQDFVAGMLPRKSGPARYLREKATQSFTDFYALRSVSFSVKRGEAVGIIGRNGAGKSTLLQIIAGTVQPTTGSIRVEGRVAALLELGSGFNPEFTGRENVILNAAVLGLNRAETMARYPGITAFADIGDFIDQPVKTYSSGMLMRLAFAVQTAVEPDILIVDEALSVGDFFFQQRCAARMRSLGADGTTLLFVSHDLASVRDLCKRTLYLRQGKVEFWGDTQEAIARYYAEGQGPAIPAAAPVPANAPARAQSLDLSTAFWRQDPASRPETPAAEWLAVDFQDEQRISTTQFRMTSQLKLLAHFKIHQTGRYRAAFELKNRHGHLVNSTSCYTAGLEAVILEAGATCLIEILLTLNFEAGRYSGQLILANDDLRPNRGRRIDVTPWLGPLDIQWDYENERAPFLGMFGPPATVRYLIQPAG